jgi:hypothetical protein
MPSRGIVVAVVLVIGVPLALIALSRYLPRDPKPVYFHRGSGQLVVTGGRDETVKLLDPPSGVYGVTYLPSNSTRSIGLDFEIAGDGGLSLAIERFAGAGQYPVVQTLGEVGDATLAFGGEVYRCYSRCGACTVTVDAASRASISGSVACSSMINCAAARLARDVPVVRPDEPCSQATPSAIDVAGTFLLDDPTEKRRDY